MTSLAPQVIPSPERVTSRYSEVHQHKGAILIAHEDNLAVVRHLHPARLLLFARIYFCVTLRNPMVNKALIYFRSCLPFVVASSIGLGTYWQARLPALSSEELRRLASGFHFTTSILPRPEGYLYRSVRAVHPSLARISAWISSVGASVALGDIDSDGLPNDFCLVDPRMDTVEVGPAPGTGKRYEPFVLNPVDVYYDSSTMAPMGCLIADLNEDGLMDVLVYYWGRPPIAFLRRGSHRHNQLGSADFKPVELVPGNPRWYTNAATLADLDGDGHLDLVVGNYFPDGAAILDSRGTGSQDMQNTMSRSSNGGRKHFLLWSEGQSGPDPSVSFKEVTPELTEDVSRGWALAVAAADINGDLLPELYFANDFGPDHFLYNISRPGHLAFKLLKGTGGLFVPKSFVLGEDSFKGMGVDFADIDQRGRLDIFVSNITSTWGLMESNFVWLNSGQTDRLLQGVAPYIQSSDALGLSRSGWAWDAKLADFDNQGELEAIQAVGFIKGDATGWAALQSLATANNEILRHPRYWPRFQPGTDLSGHEHLAFFARGPDHRYYNIAQSLDLTAPSISRGIAIADVDGDGRLDFAVADQWGDSYFYHNDCPNCGSFLGLHLLRSIAPISVHGGIVRERYGHPGSDTPGRPAIGTEATAYLPNGRIVTSQVDGGNGHSGRRSPDLHFGLGQINSHSTVRVELLWRGRGGVPEKATLHLSPGWHTIVLD
jgi:hypothetical protein